jgi:RNA polymerase sigma-70 factor (ECF subfamily)
MAAGDPAARDELINCTCEQFRRMVRKGLRQFPALRRWEDSDDVLQNASLRLWRSLRDVTPQSVRHFFNLAGTQIRRELVDLIRRYNGPQGLAANYDSVARECGSESTLAPDLGEAITHEPAQLAEWTELHEEIRTLPDEDRELFDLLWYQDLSKAQAAKILGVDERTVRRRWQAARLKLHAKLE